MLPSEERHTSEYAAVLCPQLRDAILAKVRLRAIDGACLRQLIYVVFSRNVCRERSTYGCELHARMNKVAFISHGEEAE